MKRFTLIILILVPLSVLSQEISLIRVEPANWWTGFKKTDLQLLVYGKNIATARISVDYPGFAVKKINKVANPNYLFLDMTLSPAARPGIATILFREKDKVVAKYLFELKARKKGSAERKGFSSSDVIYLIMPDRFANGDTSNDELAGMPDKLNREEQYDRHGGDLKGINNHLD
ncbi:MAG TPA: cyclomaltodextrinase N-terminal domain-containing protein, partial [Bacteroidales bacterium]|nr:cyclomaltodextrinase N-terminal domain-containing protein [Bacteroidales bacterium]